MLRLLNEKDIPALVTIEKVIQFSPWSEDTFYQCIIFGAQCWVIEVKQQIVGFVLFFSKVGEGHILNVGVHPEYQRQGYGQRLMEKILTVAAEEMLSTLYLEVRSSNEAAIALYKKVGFHPVGLRKNYYKNQDRYEDALVLEKTLIK